MGSYKESVGGVTSTEIEWFGCTLPRELKYLELFGLADYHYGNPYSDRNCWLRALEYIETKREAYAVLVGDLCDSVVLGSKGDIFTQKESVGKQKKQIIADLKPLAHKLLGATTGNHEDRVYERTGIDITEEIAEALHIPYDNEGLLLKVSFGNFNNRTKGMPFVYWIHASHGFGGARTRGAKNAKVERLASYVSADVVMMAHDHDASLQPYETLEPDVRGHVDEATGFLKGRCKAREARLVKCNSFQKWGGYARKKGFAISTLVSPCVWLGGEEKPWPMPNPKTRNLPEVRGVL